ncbi:MAG: biopolymer transporter ExbD [Myxococcota bacterium]
MAISGLPGDAEGSEDAAIVAEINITPLTDIFLVLLIIFMVTTTVTQDEGKNIDLPEATESEDTPPKSVTVAIDAEGLIKVNDAIVPAGMLAQMIGDAIEEAEEKIVVLKGDKLVLLGQAVNILDIAQQKGAKGIALATQQPAPDE